MVKKMTLDMPGYTIDKNNDIISEELVINFFKDIRSKFPTRKKVYVSKDDIARWLCGCSESPYHTLFGYIKELLNCPVEGYYGKFVVIEYDSLH